MFRFIFHMSIYSVHIFSSKATLWRQMSRLSVCQPRLGGNVIFSAHNWEFAPIFCCTDSPHKWAYILKCFVRLSVGNATEALLLMDVFILVYEIKDKDTKISKKICNFLISRMKVMQLKSCMTFNMFSKRI